LLATGEQRSWLVMANEEHLAILRQGAEVWNEWRQENPNLTPELDEANLEKIGFYEINFTGANLRQANFSEAHLKRANFKRANLKGATFMHTFLKGANFSEAHLNEAFFAGANLSKAKFIKANLTNTDFSGAFLSGADLSEANLYGASLNGARVNAANLSDTCLIKAELMRVEALNTNFARATLTGACIQDWNVNNITRLNDIECDYIYLRHEQQERRPSSGNFAPGEFTKLFQKSLETVDLIFRNGIDWDAFAYSFKKVEVENQGAQLDVQSIEKKGNGILVVRVAVAPDADKAKIHNQFMQGYEFAAKALEAQYQARLDDKDKVINQLFSTINQQNKLLAQTGDKVSIYYQPNSQFAGGIVDANNVDAQQIGGSIQNNNTEDLSS